MSQVFGLLFFYFFCCSCVPLLEDTGVAPLSIPPSFLLSSSPSLHLTAPWGVSVASPLLSSPLLSVCVCVRACVRAAVAADSSLCLPICICCRAQPTRISSVLSLSFSLSPCTCFFPLPTYLCPPQSFSCFFFVEGEGGADEGRK